MMKRISWNLDLRFKDHIDRVTTATEKPCGGDRERRHAPISILVDLVFVFDGLKE